jgi:hypothetical protein
MTVTPVASLIRIALLLFFVPSGFTCLSYACFLSELGEVKLIIGEFFERCRKLLIHLTFLCPARGTGETGQILSVLGTVGVGFEMMHAK